MKNLGYIASEITKGKNLEENLEKYGKGLTSLYNGLANSPDLGLSKEDAKRIIYQIDDIQDVMRTESMISMEEFLSDRNRLINAISV